MANFRAFHGASRLANYRAMPVAEFLKLFPGVRGINAGWHGDRWVGWTAEDTRTTLPVDRLIEWKSNPSRHECNAKCLSGKITGACECKCEGKNHGLGFRQMVAA